ncbi:MAG: PilZ domain-containing protein [Treponema sp.]|jgi:hypothetical protein|nr:PilZ domain-containing protein [Treponema sp.]
MATAIKRMEKEYILNTFLTKKLSLTIFYHRKEYGLTIHALGKTELTLKPNQALPDIGPEVSLNLLADYMGMAIFCTVQVKSLKDGLVITTIPEFLYRNLERSFTRVHFPADMKIEFACLEEKFVLPFPNFADARASKPIPDLGTEQYNEVIAHLAAWVKTFADGCKVELFKDAKFGAFEKNILRDMGKTLLLRPDEPAIPETDATGNLITQKLVAQYIETSGVSPDTLAEFVAAKRAAGIHAGAWVPLFFQQYLIGFIQVWITAKDKGAIENEQLATLYQYGSSVVAALEARKYFASCSIKNRFFMGEGVDISPAGVLFSYSKSMLAPAFPPDKEIALRLTMGNRPINLSGRIIHYFRDKKDCWGCCFNGMIPDDMRELFEYLYGKPFAESKGSLITGQV